MMAADEIWKSLSDQYDQQVAEADMELDIHANLVELMKGQCATNEQQLSAVQKKTEQTGNVQHSVDEEAEKLLRCANQRREKVEELQRTQIKAADGIREVHASLLSAGKVARDDLEKLSALEHEARNFLESDPVLPDIASAKRELVSCQESFAAQLQESYNRVHSLSTLVSDTNHLESIERTVARLRINVNSLEENIAIADAECLDLTEKIRMLQALKEDEELKRAAAEDEYRQRKTVVTELRQDLENRRNEKELQMAKLSLQREALNDKKKALEKLNTEVKTLREALKTAKENNERLQNRLKNEQKEHERRVRQITEDGENDICAANGVLMTLQEKRSKRILEIEGLRDELNKRSDLEAHKKFNEVMRRNFEQLRQDNALLQKEVQEKENRREMLSNRLQVMHCAHKAKKIEMANRRAMLMENVRRTSERVMEARKSADELERKLKEKKDAEMRELRARTFVQASDSSTHTKEKLSRKVAAEATATQRFTATRGERTMKEAMSGIEAAVGDQRSVTSFNNHDHKLGIEAVESRQIEASGDRGVKEANVGIEATAASRFVPASDDHEIKEKKMGIEPRGQGCVAAVGDYGIKEKRVSIEAARGQRSVAALSDHNVEAAVLRAQQTAEFDEIAQQKAKEESARVVLVKKEETNVSEPKSVTLTAKQKTVMNNNSEVPENPFLRYSNIAKTEAQKNEQKGGSLSQSKPVYKTTKSIFLNKSPVKSGPTVSRELSKSDRQSQKNRVSKEEKPAPKPELPPLQECSTKVVQKKARVRTRGRKETKGKSAVKKPLKPSVAKKSDVYEFDDDSD